MKTYQFYIAEILLALASCCYQAKSQDNSTTRNIYLLTLLPYPNPDPAFSPSWEEGDNIRPALELAKDQINKNTSLLPNYTLHLIHAGEGCQETTTTVVSFVEKAFQPGEDAVTGIIGPGCSISTTELGSVTNHSQLSLVHVHGSGSPTLANRTLFQYMLGTLGSTDSFVEGFLHLSNEATWENVSVLYDNTRLFYLNTIRLLLTKLKETNVTFLSPVSHTFIPVAAIQEQRLRITFVLCPLELSRKIVCLAFHRSMIYDKYQFVIIDQLREELVPPIEFLYDGTEYKCSAENMVTALEKALLITYRLTPSDDSTLISNTTYEDYLTSYTQYREDYNLQPPHFSGQRNSSYTYWATYLYDAVWAWALVLDNLTKSGGFEIGSEYGNKVQAEMIVEQFYQTKFSGMSGEISFDNETGFVNRPVNIFQVEDNNSREISVVKVGNITPISTFNSILDHFPTFHVRVPIGVAIFFLTIVILQLFITSYFQFLSVVYRKTASIKASSQRLLHISYVGTYIIGIGVFLLAFQTSTDQGKMLGSHFCQLLWAWCIPVGFILSFVPVAMRTWRVYRIFKHYLNPGPLISDHVLIGGTLLAVLVQLSVSITWTVIDPFQLKEINSTDIDNLTLVRSICTSRYSSTWYAITMAYMLSILLLVSIFSLLTRSIQFKAFTTNALRILCYLMTLLFVLGFSLYLLFSDPIYSSITLYVILISMIFVYISCLFLPPLWPILKWHYRKVVTRIKPT